MLDLDYVEDVDAEVDMNVVMTGGGRFVEVQGTGEEATFSENELAAMLKLARRAGTSARFSANPRRRWPFAMRPVRQSKLSVTRASSASRTLLDAAVAHVRASF